ncbi:hypothetical protein KIPB_002456 [Kipferlia bialata]|uniref:Uncharacterized protein n=1 Tax=Kipferlia bialata TaxID=797122 RepID=A0A9K3GG55_9EUKA|nr:hypothetical protein KIPB_002456 [Kipferlia bialata]|eukprot:g2456.t1
MTVGVSLCPGVHCEGTDGHTLNDLTAPHPPSKGMSEASVFGVGLSMAGVLLAAAVLLLVAPLGPYPVYGFQTGEAPEWLEPLVDTDLASFWMGDQVYTDRQPVSLGLTLSWDAIEACAAEEVLLPLENATVPSFYSCSDHTTHTVTALSADTVLVRQTVDRPPVTENALYTTRYTTETGPASLSVGWVQSKWDTRGLLRAASDIDTTTDGDGVYVTCSSSRALAAAVCCFGASAALVLTGVCVWHKRKAHTQSLGQCLDMAESGAGERPLSLSYQPEAVV